MSYFHTLYPPERGMNMTLNQANKTKHIAKGRTEKDDMTMQGEKKQHEAQSTSLSHNNCRANLDGD